MTSINVIPYHHDRRSEWDQFAGRAKNGVFFFQRNYLEYHADRFPDASLMFYNEEGRLLALLPATILDTTLSSHAGLTFGGMLSDTTMKAALMLEIFEALREDLRERRVQRLLYKAVPHIYHRVPGEEDLYALYRLGAKLVRRDLSSTIFMRERLPLSKGRKWAISQAQKYGLQIRKTDDFKSFMTIEEQLLEEKHNRRPVHRADEIEMLAQRFPDNIKLFCTYSGNDEMLAGVVIYESINVAHAQYIGATPDGKKKGALDLVLDHLINDYYRDKMYFDFGISTEDDGRYLNLGLIDNKQSFGARGTVYDSYEMDIV